MGNYLKVSTNSIRNAAESIEEIAETIPALMAELETAMEQLSSCWEGPAWGSFQENTALHMEMLSDIYEYMSKYVIHLQQASQDYCRAEQDVCADIRSIIMLL